MISTTSAWIFLASRSISGPTNRRALACWAQPRAVFIQYRPETEWSGLEFCVTHVERDRAWFAEQLPIMESFMDTWQTLSKQDNVRDLLVRKRIAPLPPDPEVALGALAKRPCAFLAVADDKVDEIGKGELVVDEERVPLACAFVQDTSVHVP